MKKETIRTIFFTVIIIIGSVWFIRFFIIEPDLLSVSVMQRSAKLCFRLGLHGGMCVSARGIAWENLLSAQRLCTIRCILQNRKRLRLDILYNNSRDLACQWRKLQFFRAKNSTNDRGIWNSIGIQFTQTFSGVKIHMNLIVKVDLMGLFGYTI